MSRAAKVRTPRSWEPCAGCGRQSVQSGGRSALCRDCALAEREAQQRDQERARAFRDGWESGYHHAADMITAQLERAGLVYLRPGEQGELHLSSGAAAALARVLAGEEATDDRARLRSALSSCMAPPARTSWYRAPSGWICVDSHGAIVRVEVDAA